MKVGLVVYGSLDRITGGNVYDRMLVTSLRTRGDEVEIISLRSRSYGARLFDNLSYRLPRDVDVLLQDELTHPSMLIPNLSRIRYPIVSIVHNLRSSERRPDWQNAIYRGLEGRYLRSVDGLVVNSATTLASVRTGLGIDKPSVIAPPGGDRLGSSTPQVIRERARQAGPLRLLFLANVTALKGLHILLDALALTDQARFELDVVGSCETEPGYAKNMQRQAARARLNVCFHGALDGRRLVDVIQRAQLMVVPSYYEGFGIAYLEGMAFGLPAIGTASGAIPELITSGLNGYLVAPGAAKEIASHLATVDADRNLLAKMGVSALEVFQSRPTWSQCGDLVRDFLVGLAQAR